MRIVGGVLLIICGIVMLIAGIYLTKDSAGVVVLAVNESTLGLITLILTPFALLGGVLAIMGRHFKMAVTGSVCAVASTFIGFPPMMIFSIPALAFILIQHRSFD